jgi:hypothetical protein
VNRISVSLIACTAGLAVLTGVAAMTAPDSPGASPAAASAAKRPVERTTLLCPPPSLNDLANTTYTSFTPVTKGAGSGGSAQLGEALPGESSDLSGAKQDAKGQKDSTARSGKTVLKPKEPGTPVTADADGGESPALLGTADGRFAPGWTVQQTTEAAAGIGRGLQGTSCSVPDTDFWFPGASTGHGRSDYVHLTNPDDSAAVADVEIYGKDGSLKSQMTDGITVKPHASESVLLSTLTDQAQDNVTVHVNVRSGRVGALLQAVDGKLGGDWLGASTEPASLVLPGIPKDATSVRLVAFAPGDADADLSLKLATPSGGISPAGHETLHVKGGMTAAVDLGDVTRGETGSLILTPTEGAGSVPVVAALRVIRGKGSGQETAFIPATAPIGERASVAGNTAKGTSLTLTAPHGTAKVKVTASAGSEGGSEKSAVYEIKGGTAQDLQIPDSSGRKGTYALTVEHLSGGPLYGARTLKADGGGVSAFTVQTMPDDRGMVAVPKAEQDLSVLQK